MTIKPYDTEYVFDKRVEGEAREEQRARVEHLYDQVQKRREDQRTNKLRPSNDPARHSRTAD